MRLLSAGMAVVLALIMIFAGCGKKGDPLPSRANLPAAISDLSAQAVPEGIVLKWSLKDPETQKNMKRRRG